MHLRALALLTLLATPTFAAAPPKGPPKPPPPLTADSFLSKAGKQSTVYLVSARLVEWTEASALGGKSGVRFTFLVVPTGTAKGTLALGAPTDFTLDGRAYSDLTKQGMKRPLHTKSVVEDPAKVEHRGQSVKDIFKLPAGKGSVVVATVLGTSLPMRGEARVKLDAGWNAPTEPFEFTFSLPGR